MEWLKAGREGDDRGRDCGMASPTQWTRVWVSSRSWWWTGKPGVLQATGSQRVGHEQLSKMGMSNMSITEQLNGTEVSRKLKIHQASREAWCVAVHGVAKSQTWLNELNWTDVIWGENMVTVWTENLNHIKPLDIIIFIGMCLNMVVFGPPLSLRCQLSKKDYMLHHF